MESEMPLRKTFETAVAVTGFGEFAFREADMRRGGSE
jgi:hypothetical protein